ncbi:gluconokinase [Neisseria perflava]|uniref:gluconokinase n=1 Tax=Neisseria perflava TaxID=33053 RepID=UPI00209C715D|nr:gluconokinase [Neisseria perflava]MCP1771369.1 gluconokinase [Neisseria perflava]
MTTHFIIMGVSGCGKSTVARLLQQQLACPFAEGDDFHSRANRDKMAAGIPLGDEDRAPWLAALRDWMTAQTFAGAACTVVTCSALKRRYRDTLREAAGRVVFIHLNPPVDLNRQRLQVRQGHFMKADMLDSQLAALETLAADEYGLTLRTDDSPEKQTAAIADWIRAEQLL